MAKYEDLQLFELIKSLTQGEKRSFKQIANYTSKTKKKYVYLFEQIDAQTKYDELKLQKKLLAKKIKTPLPVLKNYVQS